MTNSKVMEAYYLFQCRDWVQVIAQDESDNYIMVEQYRHGGKKIFLEFPGGVIDEGEEPEQAARREMLEETGFKIEQLTYLGFQYPNPALQENKIHIYFADKCKKIAEQSLDEHEDVAIKLISEKKLDEEVNNSGHHALMLSTYFMLKNHLNSTF